MSQSNRIAENLGVHPLVALLILLDQKGNEHRVYESWALSSTVVLDSFGLTPETCIYDPSLRRPPASTCSDMIECDVCLEEHPASEFWCLPCGHVFCEESWRARVNTLTGFEIRCQRFGCRFKMPPPSIELVCGRQRYLDFLAILQDDIIMAADAATRCTNPRCNAPIDKLGNGLCNVVKCGRCGNEFCGEGCQPEGLMHAPATCNEAKMWITSANDDVMHQREYWNLARACPSCNRPGVRVSGCNHITCYCKFEYCYFCLVQWHPTHYNCTQPPPGKEAIAERPDNIDPEFIKPYYQTAFKFTLAARDWDQKRENLPADAKEFADAVYWAKENLRWTAVHQFWQRYEQVKGLPPEKQRQLDDPPRTRQQKLLEFARSQLDALITEIDKRCQTQKDGRLAKPLSQQEIAHWTTAVNAHRDSLLKHCDLHYVE
jgi:hypothetical protein